LAVREFRNFLEPIWSIPEGGKALYFTIFTATAATGIGCQVYYHCQAVPSGTHSVHNAVHLILLDTGPTAIGAAMVSLIIVEAPKSIMVIATYLANRLLHPCRRNCVKRDRKETRHNGRPGTNGAWRRTRGANPSMNLPQARNRKTETEGPAKRTESPGSHAGASSCVPGMNGSLEVKVLYPS
jgi:hypothetical protein